MRRLFGLSESRNLRGATTSFSLFFAAPPVSFYLAQCDVQYSSSSSPGTGGITSSRIKRRLMSRSGRRSSAVLLTIAT